MSDGHLSKKFFELAKSIDERKSKQEEDRIIIHEVAQLKRNLTEVTDTSSTSSSLVEMLGHDASFGYI
jgi:AP-4 complex subunit epsilon-1